MLDFLSTLLVFIGLAQGIKYGPSQPTTTTDEVQFSCPDEFGYFPHPNDCSQYYVCVFGGALLESCTGGLMYSHELQTCDWPRNVYCENGTLIGSGGNNLETVPIATNPRHRSTTTTSTPSSYVYKPIKIENYGELSRVITNQDNLGDSSNNNQQQGRNSRSYEGSIPNYKEEIYLKNVPQQGRQQKRKKRRKKRQATLLNLLDRLRGLTRPSIQYKTHNNEKRSHSGSNHGNQYNIYPPSYYVKPIYGQILHPLDLRTTTSTTTKRPDFHSLYLSLSSTTSTARPYYNTSPVSIRFHGYSSNPQQNSNSIVLKRPQGVLQNSNHNLGNKGVNEEVKYSSQYSNLVNNYGQNNYKPPPQNNKKPQDYYDYYYYDDKNEDGQRTTTKRTTNKPFLSIKNTTPSRSVSGRIPSGKYQAESHPNNNNNNNEEYLNQRYAANIPANNSASYLYPGASPAAVQPEEEEDSSYYVYDDEGSDFRQNQDNDYKYYGPSSTASKPQPPQLPPTTTRRPPPIVTTPKQKTRSRNQPTNTKGNRPTLKPKSQLDLKAIPVRDVYVDLPSRPQNYYETPIPNTPASKCRKDSCVLPDCNCGGKDIPAGLRPEETPQLVVLTFDDSVNDLNKNLYRDLFEKGRKNPNGCPISATFYVSHEWTDYSQVQNLAADGHEIASHSVSHSFGESFSAKKWEKEINGQREILAAYGGVKLSEVRGMRAPFLAIGGNNMFKMLHDANFTYDSSMPVYENRPPSWPYTLDYKIFHDCMIPPCPTKSYPGVWEVPMVMWQDLKGGRCSMGDACSNPPTAEGVYQMLAKNFERHYTTNRAPFGLYYHAAWFTQAHHKEGFEAFLDTLVSMDDVWLVTNWQTIQWVRNPTPNNKINNFEPFNTCHGNGNTRPSRCNHPKVCNLWHKSGVRYMKTCQTCPQQYPWTGNTGVPFTI